MCKERKSISPIERKFDCLSEEDQEKACQIVTEIFSFGREKFYPHGKFVSLGYSLTGVSDECVNYLLDFFNSMENNTELQSYSRGLVLHVSLPF